MKISSVSLAELNQTVTQLSINGIVCSHFWEFDVDCSNNITCVRIQVVGGAFPLLVGTYLSFPIDSSTHELQSS